MRGAQDGGTRRRSAGMRMERITISLEDELLGELDAYMERKGYANRSEALRDVLRAELAADRLSTGRAAQCVACLTYVYNHEERELSQRLVRAQHAHHDVGLSTLHVHLDHENCMEAVILHGSTGNVREFANGIMAQRGVRHGHLHVVPADIVIQRHEHGHREAPHTHSRPKT